MGCIFMFRSNRLRQRIVIDVNSAERIGYVGDVEIDEISGRITKLIIRKHGGLLSLFRLGEVAVPWEYITAVGREFVLVKTVAIDL